MKQKGFALIIILVLVVLAVVGYLGYKNFQLKPQILTTPTPTTDPTANWKTHINTNFNFSFKYPSDWIMQEKQPTTENTTIILLSDSAIGTLQVQEGSLADSENPNLRFEYKNSILDGKTVKLQNIYINNQLNQKTYEIKDDNKTIVILLNPKTQENFEMLDQILSTFRFLK